MRYVQINDLFLVRLPGILVNLNQNYRHYNFQAFANISGKFPEISKKIQFPKNLQL